MLVRMWGKRKTLFPGMLNGTAILENNLVVSYQVKYVYQLMFGEKNNDDFKSRRQMARPS